MNETKRLTLEAAEAKAALKAHTTDLAAQKAWAKVCRAEEALERAMKKAAALENKVAALKTAYAKTNTKSSDAADEYHKAYCDVHGDGRDAGEVTIGRPGDAAATMAEETGIDYGRCLVMCNCD